MLIDELPLQILPTDLLSQFKSEFDNLVKEGFLNLHESELTMDTFSFYTSVSAVFSSKIEGENIDLDSFIKHKRFGTKYKADYTRKIDDIYNAYMFAQKTPLTQEAVEFSHTQITRNILQKSHQGRLRTGNMFVVTKDGKIEYVAAAPAKVKAEMSKLYNDIKVLLLHELSFEEIFFFASLLHLVFVKIHPFEDGNGRTSRLLEKWFLAEKLGAKAWFIQSERNYYNEHQTYYNNIRRLGLEYDHLDFSQALPFLQMLPKSILYQGKA